MTVFLDSAADLPPRHLRRLARKAQRARLSGDAGMDALSESTGVSPRQLRLLADAWAAGAAAGVEALSPAASTLSDATLAELDAHLEEWRRRHYPLETLQWQVWRNRATVHQVVPGPDRRGGPDRLPVFQLRRTADEGWHLYRTGHHGEWWPVVVVAGHRRATLDACLDAVRLDVGLQFWAAPTRASLPHRPR